MTDMNEAVHDIRAAFCATDFPQGFLEKYDQLECLASHRGLETFLVCKKDTERLFVAKCYDSSIYSGVQESGILRALRHEGLPLFAEVLNNEKMVCIIREYIEGTPLNRYAEEHDLTREQIISICVKLSDILIYLHSQTPPVIHRDIKPQNIIVREDDMIVLIDFDTARIFKDEAESDTQFLGTKGYAPPEQYGFSQTDCRSDIFSLGMVLGFLLTGGAEPEQAEGEPGDRGLRRIVARCTAFSPKERYPSALKLKQALLRQLPKAKRLRRLLLAARTIGGRHLCCYRPARDYRHGCRQPWPYGDRIGISFRRSDPTGLCRAADRAGSARSSPQRRNGGDHGRRNGERHGALCVWNGDLG